MLSFAVCEMGEGKHRLNELMLGNIDTEGAERSKVHLIAYGERSYDGLG